MSRKKNYRLVLLGIFGVFCVAMLLLYVSQNRRKKELAGELGRWLQEKNGTFVVEQEVKSDTFSDQAAFKIQYENGEGDYGYYIYGKKDGEWVKREQDREAYEKAFTEMLQACMPKGYLTKKGNQYSCHYQKGGSWKIEYDLAPEENGLEKVIGYGKEELKGETVSSKTTIWREEE